MRRARRRNEAGFTLIEVIVALAILGLALGAMAGVFGNGAAGQATAADADLALAVAEERLAAAGAEALRPSIAKGIFADRFAWRTSVSAYQDETADKAGDKSGQLLYRVEVTVDWRDGRHSRHLALSTLRLGPANP